MKVTRRSFIKTSVATDMPYGTLPRIFGRPVIGKWCADKEHLLKLGIFIFALLVSGFLIGTAAVAATDHSA